MTTDARERVVLVGAEPLLFHTTAVQSKLEEVQGEREDAALWKASSPPKMIEMGPTLSTSSLKASPTTTTLVKVNAQTE